VVTRFLVTSALEDTWPQNDTPLLFIGEWCRHYDRKTAWEKRDILVAPYHWDDRNKLYQDYLFLQELYERVLTALVRQLNEIHSVNYSERYWRIIVGPWLGYFIPILFDRWYVLRSAISTYDIAGVQIYDQPWEEGVPNDMTVWTSACAKYDLNSIIGDGWNELICGQILEFTKIHIKRIPPPKKIENLTAYKSSTSNRQKVGNFISRILGIFTSQNEFFFISTYLSISSSIFLQLRLKQIPKLWRSIPSPCLKVNPDRRNWKISLSEIDTFGELDEFIVLLKKMIPKHMPIAYLEGYKNLVCAAEHMPWPNRPKAIFDSVSWLADDIFKAWTASKTETGTPLVIGQHGGNFGMALWNFNEDHQIAISDQFVTWGWDRKEKSNITPSFYFARHIKTRRLDKSGVALLVEMAVPQQSYHMYSFPVAAGQWQKYFEEQCRFVGALSDELRDKLIVRLYPQDYKLNQKKRWQDSYPNIKIDDGINQIQFLLKRTKIFIATYNATTYLESLVLNIPTIIFWDPRYWELRESAKPLFEKLKAVRIFHESPESAAYQMAEVWNDVSGWWDNQEVQLAREEFCEHYANSIDKPTDFMASLFCNIAK
jgi:putative transferase (TIGR04331 family)